MNLAVFYRIHGSHRVINLEQALEVAAVDNNQIEVVWASHKETYRLTDASRHRFNKRIGQVE